MGRNPTGERKYQIEQMWESHHEITRLLLLGMKSKDIAAQLGVSEAMVSYTKNSALVQRQLSIMQGARDAECLDAAIEIKKRVGKALEVLDATLENENQPGLRLKAATEILDREAPKITRFEGITARLSADDILKLKNRALEVAKQAGLLSAPQSGAGSLQGEVSLPSAAATAANVIDIEVATGA
jgi:hypothetical protein